MCAYFEQAACPPCACVRVVLWSWSWLAPSNVERRASNVEQDLVLKGEGARQVFPIADVHLGSGRIFASNVEVPIILANLM